MSEQKETLPEGWIEALIGQLYTEVKERITPSQGKPRFYIGLEHLKSGGGIEEVGNSNGLKSTKGVFKRGDVLYGKLRPYLNKHAMVDVDGICSTDIIIYRAPTEDLARYLNAFLGTNHFVQFANQNSKGINLPRISPKIIKDAKIPLPPEKELNRIVTQLDALLGRVAQVRERLERLPDLLQQFRQSVLARAVSGDLTADWREINIENSWVKKQLKDFSETRLGKMLDKSKNQGELTSYLGNINVRWFDFDLDDLKQMRASTDDLEKFRIANGDVLVCEGGEPGRAAVWKAGDKNIIFQKALHRVRLNTNVLPEFFVYCLKVDASNSKLDSLFTGTTIKHLTGRSFCKYSISIPPLKEQQEIVRRVESLFALADRIEARYEELWAKVELLPQAILAKAFRGELVPQEAGDEPAGVLLERIKKGKR